MLRCVVEVLSGAIVFKLVGPTADVRRNIGAWTWGVDRAMRRLRRVFGAEVDSRCVCVCVCVCVCACE